MNYFIILTSFVVMFQGAASQNCSDCMNYDKCPTATKLFMKLKEKPDEATRQLLRNELCQFNYTQTPPIAMICCSNLEESILTNHPYLTLLPTRCGDLSRPRIVNGEEADLYEFPWMALISYNNSNNNTFQCGGSIINERYILTAAHCVHKKSIAHVRVGEYNIQTDSDCQNGECVTYIKDIRVEKVHIHENYIGMPILANDIALLRLAETMNFTKRNVDSVCLPKTKELRDKFLDNEEATVAGWGLTENQTNASILRKATVTIGSAETCSNLYNRYTRPGEPSATTNKLCAGQFGKGPCKGDSGGPLTLLGVYNNGYRHVQYGVISYGNGPCGSSYTEVFTDVTKFMLWILNNIAP